MFVHERMSTPVVTARADAPITSVISLLESRAISAVPIIDDGRLVGILSTTDIVGASADEPSVTAAQRMTKVVITADAHDPLDEAARRLVAARVHRLVVMERGQVVGVLSARDILDEVRARRVTAPISRIMTPEVVTVDVGDTIDVAIERLARARVHGLAVMDGTAPVGVFTHAEALAARKLPPTLRSGPVEEVMSYETICLDATTPVHRAAAYCTSMDVRRILVVDHRHLVGILSVVDLVGVLARAEA
jgi:CBS domain-containing protein